MFYNNGWIIWPINLNNPKVANDIIMAECASPRNAGKRKRYNFRNDIPILTQFLEYDEIDEYSKKYVRGFLNLLRQMRLLDVSPEAMRQASLPGQKQLSDRGEIRQERDPKERYFIPFSKQKGYLDYPAQGRKKLMVESLRSWSRVKGFQKPAVKTKKHFQINHLSS